MPTQQCPKCGRHSLEYDGYRGGKICLWNDCPFFISITPADARRLEFLRQMDELLTLAIEPLAGKVTGITRTLSYLQSCVRSQLAEKLEGDPDWPEYQDFVKKIRSTEPIAS